MRKPSFHLHRSLFPDFRGEPSEGVEKAVLENRSVLEVCSLAGPLRFEGLEARFTPGQSRGYTPLWDSQRALRVPLRQAFI
jgi:hypothetical protein